MKLKSMILAAALATAFAAPAAALTSAEVLDAMQDRVVELRSEIGDLRGQLRGATGAERGRLRAEIRMLTARQRQLVTLQRIVPRYPERRLERLVAYYGLDVSPA
jgi:hypothetical protein